jgi:hypothetical protein
MVANFHDIDVDQFEIAHLTSVGSIGNLGTRPSDMMIAMRKLGFVSRALNWDNPENFYGEILPKTRHTIVHEGPIYVSFKAGVFGSMGHGCVIVGYDDRKEKLQMHNMANQSSGLVFTKPPKIKEIADEAQIVRFQSKVPSLSNGLQELYTKLSTLKIPFKLI